MQNDYRFDREQFSIATVTFRLAFNSQFVHTFPMYPTKQSIRFPFRQLTRAVYLASEPFPYCVCGHCRQKHTVQCAVCIVHIMHGVCTMNVKFTFGMRAALQNYYS